jgi:hypothetical protein
MTIKVIESPEEMQKQARLRRGLNWQIRLPRKTGTGAVPIQ